MYLKMISFFDLFNLDVDHTLKQPLIDPLLQLSQTRYEVTHELMLFVELPKIHRVFVQSKFRR